MSGARHDVYIIDDGHGGALVRPSTFAVSPCCCGIRFRNLTRSEATLDLSAGPFTPARPVLGPGEGGIVFINWTGDNPARTGTYDYTVTVNGSRAKGNSEPTIIVDL